MENKASDFPLEKLLTINDLSQITSLKESHIRSLIFKKQIPHIKMGRLIRFRLQDIEDFLKINTVKPE